MTELFAEQVRDLGDTFDDPDWNAVIARARAPRRRAPRRRLVIALTLTLVLVGALAATPAFGLRARLVVVPNDVVQPGGRCLVAEGAVWSAEVVSPEVVGQGRGAFG